VEDGVNRRRPYFAIDAKALETLRGKPPVDTSLGEPMPHPQRQYHPTGEF
jgi:hypothetical protein